MTTLYMVCGLPFSGKSLLSKEIEKRTSIKRVSFDDTWDIISKTNQNSPFKITLTQVEKTILENLSKGISVVYDRTNLKSEDRDKLKKLAEEIGARVQIIYLPISIDEIHKRRALSIEDKTHHIVNDESFNRALEQLEPPTDCVTISTNQEKDNFLKSLESESKNHKSKITFINEPKLSEHEVDKSFNERRITLIPYIKNFISTHSRFSDKDIKVTFAQGGISAIISIIETPDEKLVFKIPLSKTSSPSEGKFLEIWGKAGVKVPHVIEYGLLKEYQYLLMEYIDALPLKETYDDKELVEKKIFMDMGGILRLMHVPKTTGYGRLIDNKPEFITFRDWLEDIGMKKRIKYVQENNLLGEEHGSLTLMLDTLLSHVGNTSSSYCHNDFSLNNIFATKPLTVFDPGPTLNNGYIDLGRSLYILISHGQPSDAREQLIKGYFDGELFDVKVLQASVLLACYMKLPYAHKTKKLENIKRIQEYLIQTKHLMEN